MYKSLALLSTTHSLKLVAITDKCSIGCRAMQSFRPDFRFLAEVESLLRPKHTCK